LGVLNVFFRDVGQFFGIFITFWFWLTPIVYPVSILPERVQSLMALNPMASLIGAMQGVLVHGEWPQWGSLLYPFALGLALCFIGLRLFRRRAGEMVDEL
jgi:lipopolysaccharide transport system permease protein